MITRALTAIAAGWLILAFARVAAYSTGSWSATLIAASYGAGVVSLMLLAVFSLRSRITLR